jgi:hypothetical protein
MNAASFGARFRERERVARAALERGCYADLVWADRFVKRRVRETRGELAERILSLGAVDPELHETLASLEAEAVARHCARDVLANADVRFRARFRLYASALPGRQIRLPHLELDNERPIVPRCSVFPSTFDEWLDELEETLLGALREAIETACNIAVTRGIASLARSGVASYLAVGER